MNHTGYELLWIFLSYSFLGWVLETIAAAVKQKRFLNRGVLTGPVCTVYGIGAVVLTVFLWELVQEEQWGFLFLGSMIWSTAVEWLAGRSLEKLHHSRWWDYSEKKWNLDGYICLEYAVLWGVLGVICLRYGNPMLLRLYHLLPEPIMRLLLLLALAVLILDAVSSYLVVMRISKYFPQMESVHNRIAVQTVRLGRWVAEQTQRRMEKAYPGIQRIRTKEQQQGVFAPGCSFYKLAMLFFIGSFLGDVTETIFCRVRAGIWMSRSSVVWGPFSIVWGLAIMLATLVLYNYRNRSDSFIFLFGTVLGGAYEYICSVFTELVFGTVFWDYSEIPFNLGGRINLLYCFFWGIAAVVWLKLLYPPLSRWIERIPKGKGILLTWCLIVFMCLDIAVSAVALMRYTERSQGKEAVSSWEKGIDERFDDERMARIYPNAILTK
ncbi:MAG: putative ABC transporter permease [Lachnospiraceae bacterium]|nr:putative ABC transporter permease [Lachnospiraceae bacterium]